MLETATSRYTTRHSTFLSSPNLIGRIMISAQSSHCFRIYSSFFLTVSYTGVFSPIFFSSRSSHIVYRSRRAHPLRSVFVMGRFFINSFHNRSKWAAFFNSHIPLFLKNLLTLRVAATPLRGEIPHCGVRILCGAFLLWEEFS